MSKDLQNQINKKVKYISLGSNFTNSYWPAKISTMNSMKITTFKPTIQKPMTKFNKPTIQKPMTKFNKPTIQNPMTKFNKPIFSSNQ